MAFAGCNVQVGQEQAVQLGSLAHWEPQGQEVPLIVVLFTSKSGLRLCHTGVVQGKVLKVVMQGETGPSCCWYLVMIASRV